MKKLYLILAIPVVLFACKPKDNNPPASTPPATPHACFTVSKTLFDSGETVKFTNCSTNASTYFWDFGEGIATSSTSANPSYVYNKTRASYHVTLKTWNSDQSKENDSATNVFLGYRMYDSVRINNITSTAFKPGISYLFQCGPGTNSSRYSVKIPNAVNALPMTFSLTSDTVKIVHGVNDNSWRGRIISDPAGQFIITFGATSTLFLSRGLNNSPIHVVDNGVDMDWYYHLVKP